MVYVSTCQSEHWTGNGFRGPAGTFRDFRNKQLELERLHSYLEGSYPNVTLRCICCDSLHRSGAYNTCVGLHQERSYNLCSIIIMIVYELLLKISLENL